MMATLFIQDVSELSKPFDVTQSLPSYQSLSISLKAFRDSEVNPMSSLALTWYINTHPHMHKAEAGERVRVSIFSTY
jgi:hypothetical protein